MKNWNRWMRIGTGHGSLALVGIAVAALLVGGCGYTMGSGTGVQIVSNIPYNTLTVKVVNGTNFNVTLIDDSGKNSQTLRPGAVAIHNFWNLSGTSAQASLVAMATDESGRVVGTANRSFYVYGTSRQSESWVLSRYDFRQ